MTFEYTIRLVGGKEDETAMVTCETRHRLRRVTICYRDSRIEESASDCFKLFARCGFGSKVKGGTCFATVRVWRSAHQRPCWDFRPRTRYHAHDRRRPAESRRVVHRIGVASRIPISLRHRGFADGQTVSSPKHFVRRDHRITVNGYRILQIPRVAACISHHHGDAAGLGDAEDEFVALFQSFDG